YPVTGNVTALWIADLNHDDFPEVIANVGHLDILFNRGNGSFDAPRPVPADGTTTLIDWNGDGHLDFISLVSGLEPYGVVGLANGDATFVTRSQIFTANPPTLVKPIDLNGDHRFELIALNTQSNSVDVWEHAAVTGTNRLLSSFNVGRSIAGF